MHSYENEKIYNLIAMSYDKKHPWSNGMIVAFQAADPGSTPGGCNFLF